MEDKEEKREEQDVVSLQFSSIQSHIHFQLQVHQVTGTQGEVVPPLTRPAAAAAAST